MAVSYKDLGLVNTKDMFAKAMKGHYAIPAFNFNNMEQLQAIIQACTEKESPVILQVSKGARNYANRVLSSTPRKSAMARVRFRSACIWITEIPSSCARAASNSAFPR